MFLDFYATMRKCNTKVRMVDSFHSKSTSISHPIDYYFPGTLWSCMIKIERELY